MSAGIPHSVLLHLTRAEVLQAQSGGPPAVCAWEIASMAGEIIALRNIARATPESVLLGQSLIETVGNVEPSFEDERIKYVEVQIDREDWLAARRMAAAAQAERDGGTGA